MSNYARNPEGNPADKVAIAIGRDVAKRIEVICSSRNIPFHDVELHIGKAKGAISGIVAGRRGTATTGVMLVQIADALDVDVGWLMTGRGSEHAFSRAGFKACGVTPSSQLWPAALRPLAKPLVSGTTHGPTSRKTKRQR